MAKIKHSLGNATSPPKRGVQPQGKLGGTRAFWQWAAKN